MTTSSSTFDWVPQIEPNLKQLDSIPLTGNAPPFPWEDLAQRLSACFDQNTFKIEPGEMSWKSREKLYEGMGVPFPLTLSIPSIDGLVCWVIPSQELPMLAALLFTKESHPLNLLDETFCRNFYQFLAIEVLYHFTQIDFDASLSPILSHEGHLPDEDSLCWDISIVIQNHTISGRLILSPQFRLSWVKHFANKHEKSPLSEKMAQQVDVEIHLEAGKTQLSVKEWMSVKPGDFLALDSFSLDPEKLDGRILLTLNGKPLFRAKLKESTLKILELPLLHEV